MSASSPANEVKGTNSTSPAPQRVTRSRRDHSESSSQFSAVHDDEGGTGTGTGTGTGLSGKGKRKHEDARIPVKIRISRRKTDNSDPSIRLAKALTPSSVASAATATTTATAAAPVISPTAAASTRQTRSQATPEAPTPTRETRASSRGLPRDKTPEALLSPSVAASSPTAPESDGAAAVKLQLLKSLRTSLPEYLSLKSLRNAPNKTIDLMGVATATPAPAARPKHGGRDYMLAINLTDPSVAPTGVNVANLFRPHGVSLPVLQAGDVLLLRRVQVVTLKGRGYGVRSNDASAWAVFEKGDEEMLPQIKGPPVEITDDEHKYAEGLRRWWGLQDSKALGKIERANRKLADDAK